MTPEPILAVDFGTSTSAAILVTAAGEEFVADPAGTGLTWPSAACLDGGELYVGTEAERRKRRLARYYRAEFKLELGRAEAVQLGSQPVPVSELITKLLAEMRTAAQRMAGEPVTRAVLTIPASYDQHDKRRALMIEAATEAGFALVELLAEPVAAALAPVLGPPFSVGNLILVYDLGGGTFDTALIRTGQGSNAVLGHAAIDRDSGGRDIDSALYEELLKTSGQPLADLITADRARLELIARTEELKRRLTTAGKAEDSIGDDDILLAASRDRLEELAAPVIGRTIECVETMLTGTGTEIGDVGKILLVGGAVQMPIVGRTVQAAFGRTVRTAKAPQLAVVQGAAKFAAAGTSRFVAPSPLSGTERPLRWQLPADSATLVRWRVQVGEVFEPDQALADVRLPDGAVYELRSANQGEIKAWHAIEGATVISGDWLITSVAPPPLPVPGEPGRAYGDLDWAGTAQAPSIQPVFRRRRQEPEDWEPAPPYDRPPAPGPSQ